MSEEKHNIVIVGAGIIGTLRNTRVWLIVGCCTAYYIARHPAFSLKTHTLSVLEASSPASGASGKVSFTKHNYLQKAGGLLSRDWHRGPTVSLAKLSFNEHANLAAQHNGKDKWEYRRLDVYAVDAIRSNKSSTRGKHIPEDLSWLDQQGLSVQEASKDGTVDDVFPVSYCIWKLKVTVDGTSSSI